MTLREQLESLIENLLKSKAEFDAVLVKQAVDAALEEIEKRESEILQYGHDALSEIAEEKSKRERAEINFYEKRVKLEALVKELAGALGKVDAWFERMAKDQHEKLVENQTLESASANWDSLLNEPLDMVPIKAALAKVPEGLR